MVRHIRNAFIGGLILLAPLGVTLLVVDFLLDKVGTPASSFFLQYIQPDQQREIGFVIKVVATLVVISLITIVGFFSNYFFGKFVIRFAEGLVVRLPFINTVYGTVKQIVQTFSSQKRAVFQKVVLLEFPRKRLYVIGFLTGENKGEVQSRTGDDLVNIFVPTTPNPTSGFLIMIPKQDVIFLDMTVTDGMKFIISGGAVVPVYDPQTGEQKFVEVQKSPQIVSTVSNED